MDNINIVMSQETYSHYMEVEIKWNILRDILSKSQPYTWENLIRGVMDIPKEENDA